MKNRSYVLICILCLVLCAVFIMSSCSASAWSRVVSAEINGDGELILSYADGREQNLGVVVGEDGKDGADGEDGAAGADGADGSMIITNEGNLIPAAIAKGLRSAVSIVCNFTSTESGLYPGSSGTASNYSSSGSGIIYELDRTEGDAFIITNYHVVYDASSDTDDGISEDISVYLYGAELSDKAIAATYVGGSLYYDVAVLRVENSQYLKTSDVCEAEVADSDSVFVGDTAIAIGNAKGYGISASVGVVSVDSEHISMTAADESTTVSFRVMRVDAAVNPGNSGGGLYSEEGELIGVVNAKIVDDSVESIGYAIPSNVATAVADNIIDHCYGTDTKTVQRALLGVTVITADSAAVYDATTGLIRIEETVSVHEIAAGSISDGVLEVGDVLLSASLNGKTVDITRQYRIVDLMLTARAGDTLCLTVERLVGDAATELTLQLYITGGCIISY